MSVLNIHSHFVKGVVILTMLMSMVSLLPTLSQAQTISSVFPDPSVTGSAVTINGSGFGTIQGGNTVAFDTSLSTVLSWSDTKIEVEVPPGEEGAASVVAAGSAPFGVTVQPIINSIAVAPTTPTISVGGGQPFTATATLSDATTPALTQASILGISLIAGANRLVAVDPVTGSLSPISNPLPGPTTISAGVAALDGPVSRYFVSAGGRLITIAVATGVVTDFPFSGTSGVSSLEYDALTNMLFGIAVINDGGGVNKLVTVDPATGIVTPVAGPGIGILPGPQNISAGPSAMDVDGNRYFVTTGDQIVTMNTMNGTFTNATMASLAPDAGATGVSSLEYDSVGGTLYGMTLFPDSVATGGTPNKLVTVNPGTGEIADVAAGGAGLLPDPRNVSAGAATLDAASNRHVVSVGGNLVVVDTTSGAVSSAVAFPGVSSLEVLPLWNSSDPAVATINQNGNVIGLKGGTSIIAARANNIEDATLLTVTTNVDLTIDSIVDSSDPVTANAALSYTISIMNTDLADPVDNVTLTNTFPFGATNVVGVPVQGTCDPATGTEVTCSLGTIPANTTIQVVVNMKAPASAGSVDNMTTVTATFNVDPTPANDTVIESTTVNAVDKIWNGSVDNVWNTPANWEQGAAPLLDETVLIPNTANQPIINSNPPRLGGLTVEAGATLTVGNGRTLILSGTITNSGTILVNSTTGGVFTDLRINGDVTLTGGGTLTLSTTAVHARVRAQTATDRLTNVDNTIQGTGNLGANFMALTNQGTIVATATGGGTVLTIDPSTSGAINTGLLRANGGTLELLDGTYDNTNGTIEARDGDVVELNGATVFNGTLQTTAPTGVIRGTGTTTLDGVMNTGAYEIDNGRITNLVGTITNSGTILVDSTTGGVFTDLRLQGDVTLTGGGTLTLSTTAVHARVRAQAPTDRLTNVDNTIQGTGNLGSNSMALTNQGTIVATATGGGTVLTINPSASGAMNSGLLQANGGTLRLQGGTYTNTGSTIEALAGSVVELNAATVVNGTLQTTGTGVIRHQPGASNVTLNGVTNAGAFVVPDGELVDLIGTITNSGTILVDSTTTGRFTDLRLQGDVTLTGGGTLTLSTTAVHARVRAQAATDRLTNVDNTIQGTGNLGNNSMALTNQGTIVATATGGGTVLTIDPSTSGAIHTGILRADVGSTLAFTDATSQTAGSLLCNGGPIQFPSVDLQGGILTGIDPAVGSCLNGDVTNSGGVVSVGSSAGKATITGNYIQTAGGTLNMELGGLTPGTQHDQLVVTGTATLGGTLIVRLLPGYVPSATNMFSILTYGSVVGDFAAKDLLGGVSLFSATPLATLYEIETLGNPITVTSSGTSGVGSLREAITTANATGGIDLIAFNIGGGGQATINLAMPLPTITDPVVIDGYTQPGSSLNTLTTGNNATINIELDGTNVSGGSGLEIVTGNSTVRGLVINQFDQMGIEMSGGGNNVIEGNFIGTDPTGTLNRGNTLNGVFITTGSTNNLIGGLTPGAANVISGNLIHGISVFGVGVSGNVIQGNLIGTNAAGTAALGNDAVGVLLAGVAGNTVGGTTPGARNVISGNGEIGVEIFDPGAVNNRVQGNLIGTDITGLLDVGNALAGVEIDDGPSFNTIGGTEPGARNIISGNDEFGVEIAGDNNLVQGNYIGVGVDGVTPIGNTLGGVGIGGIFLIIVGNQNQIGGVESGAGNLIASNEGPGVTIVATGGAVAMGNQVLGNAIFDNASVGIDLGFDAVTLNDADDSDTGPNNLQNFPEMTVAFTGSTAVQGTMTSTPNTQFILEFFSTPTCDASGHGEGETFLGRTAVTTDGTGVAPFNAVFSPTAPVGHFLTSTATEFPGNNTSEFSQCLEVKNAGVVTHSLNVTTNGNGSGTVQTTVSGQPVLGIDCGGGAVDCTEVYPQNTVLTLTATAPAGSVFVQWSGEGCAGVAGASCTLALPHARTITATFCPDTGGCEFPPPLLGVEVESYWFQQATVAWRPNPICTSYFVSTGTTPGIFGAPVSVPGTESTVTLTNLPPVDHVAAVQCVIAASALTASSSLEGSALTEEQVSGLSASPTFRPMQGREDWTVVDEGTPPSDWVPGANGSFVQQANTQIPETAPGDLAKRGTFAQKRTLQCRQNYTMSFQLLSESPGALGGMVRVADVDHYYRFSLDWAEGFTQPRLRLLKRANGVSQLLAEEVIGDGEEEDFEPGNMLLKSVTFQINNEQLSVNLGGGPLRFGGIVQDTLGPILQGTNIALYAWNNPGSRFSEPSVVEVVDYSGAPPPICAALEVGAIGTGSGQVSSTPVGIQLPGQPAVSYEVGTQVGLLATPDTGMLFNGWSGDNADCQDGQVTVQTNTRCEATFTGVPSPSVTLDVDDNGVAEADFDGKLIVAYLFGLRGDALVQGNLGSNATRTTASAIEAYLGSARTTILDVDANNQLNPMTDGQLLKRFIAGTRGANLITGVVDPSGARNTASAIEAFLSIHLPAAQQAQGVTANNVTEALVVADAEVQTESAPLDEESEVTGEELTTAGETTVLAEAHAALGPEELEGSEGELVAAVPAEPAQSTEEASQELLEPTATRATLPALAPAAVELPTRTATDPIDPAIKADDHLTTEVSESPVMKRRPLTEASVVRERHTRTVVATADSTLLRQAPHRNVGAQPVLQVGGKNSHHAVLQFALPDLRPERVVSAQLVLTPYQGRMRGQRRFLRHPMLEVRPLTDMFEEGNGQGGKKKRVRGKGAGVTWACAVDSNIRNNKADCDHEWAGGQANLPAGIATIPLVFDSVTQQYQSDVLSLARRVVEDGQANLVLLMMPTTAQGVWLYGKESGGNFGAASSRVPHLHLEWEE